MKILIVGGGGREHALAWRLSKSRSVKGVIVSPGNPGIAQVATCVPAPTDITGYAAIAQAHGADLTIVGPEAPLVAGIVDDFYQKRLKIIGPTREAAKLEGSKVFAKRFLQRMGIPTARSVDADSYDEAVHFLKNFAFPLVIKADGLAAGKGVIIAQDEGQAKNAIERLGPDLVLEEFLEGEEVSFIGISNGQAILPLAPTQDHKTDLRQRSRPEHRGYGRIRRLSASLRRSKPARLWTRS